MAWCAGFELVCVVVVDELVVVVVATAVPVPGEFAGVVLVDDPQPAASRAAPSTPRTAARFRVLSISIHQDA